jgi:hypothetical protein
MRFQPSLLLVVVTQVSMVIDVYELKTVEGMAMYWPGDSN